MTATISPCGKYRYFLSREIGQELGVATFIMLNPSTADATKNDPTIRKCMGFARKWGMRHASGRQSIRISGDQACEHDGG